jgi:hypothetical protein
MVVKVYDQRRLDSQRQTFKVTFPIDLDSDSVTAWIRAISGTLRMTSSRVSGVPTLGFEVWATNEGIIHRLKIPWQHADYVIKQLQSLVPGIRVEPDPHPPRRRWTTAVEVGLTHSARPLRIYNAADVATSLLASMQALKEGETVLMQWVITPAVPQHLPIYQQAHSDTFHVKALSNGTLANRDEVKERREKLSEPNVMAVLRIAGLAETPGRAQHLVMHVRHAL